MLGEEFKTWPADLLSNATLVILNMHVTNLDYLEDGPLCFMELLDGNTEKSNKMLVGLNTAAVIPKSNNQDPPNLIDLEVEWAIRRSRKLRDAGREKLI